MPVANEPVGAPEKYGDDRFLVYLRLEGDENPSLDRELLRSWETAIRSCASICTTDMILVRSFALGGGDCSGRVGIGIHPFNQPTFSSRQELAKQAMEKPGTAKKAGASRKDEVKAADS